MTWLPLVTSAEEFVLGGRVKASSTYGLVPSHDVRRLAGAQTLDGAVDVRMNASLRKGSWQGELHYEVISIHGDSVGASAAFLGDANGGSAANSTARADGFRLFGLAQDLSDGSRHRVRHRLDRMWIGYQSDRTSIRVGRQALSWGNGVVFAPLDLLTPFAPAQTDRDFKAGDDMVLVQQAFASGGDVQVVAVGRRDENDDRKVSYGLKLHGAAGLWEGDLLLAKHFGEQVIGFGVSGAVGSAVARLDYQATRVRDVGWRHSVVLNADYSWDVGAFPMYGFVELYYNGFGSVSTPDNLAELATTGAGRALSTRLARGEVFALTRRYMATGGNIQWHPLWSQTALVIWNLGDGSALFQSVVQYVPDDRQSLELALTATAGARGDEFGGIPIADAALFAPASAPTAGAGRRAHIRYSLFF